MKDTSAFLGMASAVALALLSATGAKAALIAEYNFNEGSGTTVNPTVGTVIGALTGAANFVSGGIDGGAVNISSSGGGLVNFGQNLFPTGPFSVQIWVETTDAAKAIPVSYHTSTVVAGYIIGINDIGDGCGAASGSASFYVAYPCSGSSSIKVIDGKWHQLVGVYNGNKSSIYVDGQLESSSSGGNPLNTPPSTTDFLLGGYMVGTTPTNSYNGLVSDLQIYNNALSPSDVLGLYNSALSPVPEPSTWALILLGFAGLGFAGYRRNKAAAVAA
jgi:hypothetical protein